jgi:hypothetical protein
MWYVGMNLDDRDDDWDDRSAEIGGLDVVEGERGWFKPWWWGDEEKYCVGGVVVYASCHVM